MTTRDDIVQHIAHSLGIQVDPQAKARALLDEACPLPSPDDDHRCGWRDGFSSCGNLLEKSKSRIAELEAELAQFVETSWTHDGQSVYRKMPCKTPAEVKAEHLARVCDKAAATAQSWRMAGKCGELVCHIDALIQAIATDE